ncbi:MAG TPA: hypothetical protein VGH73_24455 [Thermoanaerobaculia bacterium]|jgi:hypothetical protein
MATSKKSRSAQTKKKKAAGKAGQPSPAERAKDGEGGAFGILKQFFGKVFRRK